MTDAVGPEARSMTRSSYTGATTSSGRCMGLWPRIGRFNTQSCLDNELHSAFPQPRHTAYATLCRIDKEADDTKECM